MMTALLNALLLLPLAGFLAALFVPRREPGLARWTALFFSLTALPVRRRGRFPRLGSPNSRQS